MARQDGSNLSDIDLFLSIRQALNGIPDWKQAVDKAGHLLRSRLIFDNLVIYSPGEGSSPPDLVYARAVGRGRRAYIDIAWGETVAVRVLAENSPVEQGPEGVEISLDRLDSPYILGLPVTFENRISGALVLIRFGGPGYTGEDLTLARFFTAELAACLEHTHLRSRLSQLEAEHLHSHLQENFISTISHELLTPLGFIKGYATTLLRPDTNWDEKTRQEFLTIIDHEADRLQELIDNLLDSTRLQSGMLRMVLQPTRIDSLVGDAIIRIRTQKPDVSISAQIHPPIRSILADPRRLAQVIENLVSNAIKYAPRSPILFSLYCDEKNIYISVQDHGPGIPVRDVPHLFERFYRSPDQALQVRGTGLGLFICKQIIEAHHGEISIVSTAGEGTTVNIALPCPPGDSTEGAGIGD